jgi:molybdenum cofactor cytidylyltransferase
MVPDASFGQDHFSKWCDGFRMVFERMAAHQSLKNPSLEAGETIAALIPAAGRSSRMGAMKPLLPLGRDTLLSRIIGLFRAAAISDILVVLGHEAESFIPFLQKQGVRWVINPDYDRGMFSSVQTGVSSLNPACRAFFLMPADVPLVRPETLKTLINVYHEAKGDVYRPCYRGKRGHPPLITANLIAPILDFAEQGGLRALLARYERTSLDVACEDPGILIDLDTPEDLKKAAALTTSLKA